MCFFISAEKFPCLGIISRVANASASDPIMLVRDVLSLGDLLPPLFVFLMSLSYQYSFDKRFARDGKKAYIHFIVRYLCFMGAGSILVSGEYFVRGNGTDPVILQTILMFGVIGLLPVMLIISPIKAVPKKVKKIITAAVGGMLVTLGIIDLILGIIDVIFVFGGLPYHPFKHWSILHSIGMPGLLLLPFMRLKLKDKIIAWWCILAVHTAVQLIPGILECFNHVVLGGLSGAPGRLIIMLGGVILIKFYESKKYPALLASVGIVAALTAGTMLLLPIDPRGTSVNYMLLELLAGTLLFLFINLFNNRTSRFDFLVWWGRNPLLLFLIGAIAMLIVKVWDPAPDTSLLTACAFVFGGFISMTAIAYVLYKKDIIVKL